MSDRVGPARARISEIRFGTVLHKVCVRFVYCLNIVQYLCGHDLHYVCLQFGIGMLFIWLPYRPPIHPVTGLLGWSEGQHMAQELM